MKTEIKIGPYKVTAEWESTTVTSSATVNNITGLRHFGLRADDLPLCMCRHMIEDRMQKVKQTLKSCK